MADHLRGCKISEILEENVRVPAVALYTTEGLHIDVNGMLMFVEPEEYYACSYSDYAIDRNLKPLSFDLLLCIVTRVHPGRGEVEFHMW